MIAMIARDIAPPPEKNEKSRSEWALTRCPRCRAPRVLVGGVARCGRCERALIVAALRGKRGAK